MIQNFESFRELRKWSQGGYLKEIDNLDVIVVMRFSPKEQMDVYYYYLKEKNGTFTFKCESLFPLAEEGERK